MNRKSIIRRNRKEILRMGGKIETEVLNRDDEGRLYPKSQWGYCVRVRINGWHCSAPDRNWYDAWKAALDVSKWAAEQEPFSEASDGGKNDGDGSGAEEKPSGIADSGRD